MKIILVITIALIGLFTTCFGQQNTTWEKWNWLMGEWVGEGSGQAGQGGGYFAFNADLENNILIRKSHSEYVASGNRPKIIHDDLMIVYTEHSGNPYKSIYFDNEGHTINYLVTFSDSSIIFTSENMLDVPAFRLTYTLLDKETVNTKFEISQDGVNFSTYIEGKSKKTK
jgi:hypothetical protein